MMNSCVCVILRSFRLNNRWIFYYGPFISFLANEAEINQAKVKIGAKKIEAFGALDDSVFREKLQEISTTLLRIDDSIEDKATMLMQVFNYCVCSEILPGQLHDTTTTFSGSSTREFRQYLEVPAEQRLGGTSEA